MTLGTGPEALVDDLLLPEWQARREGRPDIPDVVRDSNGNPSNDPNDTSEPGKVLVVNDRDVVANNHGVHDLVHCYHPQAGGVSMSDSGYKEKNVVETVQIDIEVTDRTDPDTGERVYARERLVGTREQQLQAFGFTLGDESGATLGTSTGGTTGASASSVSPYPGISGEVRFLLEGVRRGFEEWDVARSDVVNLYLGNSNANISYSVELEHIATNTVQ